MRADASVRSTYRRRRYQAELRRSNIADGMCINENQRKTHGPATHGVRCERCHDVWLRSR